MNSKGTKNIRYNVLTIFIYIVAIVLIIQLFNLQIIQGEKFLEQSSSRLTRETIQKAARGNILDNNGNILATTKNKYSLEIYKSKIDNKTLNDTLLEALKVLETNQDKYKKDTFPIEKDSIAFSLDMEQIVKWFEDNNLDKTTTPEQLFNLYKEKYDIKEETNSDFENIRKIIGMRYEIEKNGYTARTPYLLADDISFESVAIFQESNSKFPGLSIKTTPIRDYENGSLASHILGYVGSISKEELEKNEGYGLNDYIGKSGIEFVLEKYLKGEDGIKQTDMSIDGTTTGEYITKEAVSGKNVYLTIDAKIQSAAEIALKKNIEKISAGDFGKVYDAKAGSVVVMNVNSGEVLALASYPNFEPGLFSDGISQEKWDEYTDAKALFNRAVQSAYAPGSIFKMVTAIAGLQTGAITIDEKITDLGVYPLGNKPVCWIWAQYRKNSWNDKCIRSNKTLM